MTPEEQTEIDRVTNSLLGITLELYSSGLFGDAAIDRFYTGMCIDGVYFDKEASRAVMGCLFDANGRPIRLLYMDEPIPAGVTVTNPFR